jgi:Ca2+:H+ antiporter
VPPGEDSSARHDAAGNPIVETPNASAGEEKSDKEKGKQGLIVRMKNGSIRFVHHLKNAIFHSYVNILLIFVPAGIAVRAAGVNPTVVFALNAVAIIPLAGLLSHATESVASRLGDTVGALINVTFGNAVELIIL